MTALSRFSIIAAYIFTSQQFPNSSISTTTRSCRTCTLVPDRHGSTLNNTCQSNRDQVRIKSVRYGSHSATYGFQISKTGLTYSGHPHDAQLTGDPTDNRIQNSFWSTKPYTSDDQHTGDQVLVITDTATAWKPLQFSNPVSLSITNTTQLGSIYQLFETPTNVNPQQSLDETNLPIPTRTLDTRLAQQLEEVNPTTIPKFRSRHTSTHFQTHVATLQDWENLMLQHVLFAVDPIHIAYQIRDCQNNHRSLVAIVDQCSQHQTACYGWNLYLSNGEALAECHGQNLGPPSGPRAAAWGLLSVTTFLKTILDYLTKPPTFLPSVRILGRNSKIIRYLHNRSKYPTLFCNATLGNNWDILEQTHTIAQQSNITIKWETVEEYRKTHHLSNPPPFSLEQSMSDTKEHTRKFHQENSHPSFRQVDAW